MTFADLNEDRHIARQWVFEGERFILNLVRCLTRLRRKRDAEFEERRAAGQIFESICEAMDRPEIREPIAIHELEEDYAMARLEELETVLDELDDKWEEALGLPLPTEVQS